MGMVGERVRRVITYSEVQALKAINDEMGGNKEAIVISKNISDKAGLARSVIVSGLRLLEAAGIVETKSLGMKGTNIRILDQRELEEVIK